MLNAPSKHVEQQLLIWEKDEMDVVELGVLQKGFHKLSEPFFPLTLLNSDGFHFPRKIESESSHFFGVRSRA